MAQLVWKAPGIPGAIEAASQCGHVDSEGKRMGVARVQARGQVTVPLALGFELAWFQKSWMHPRRTHGRGWPRHGGRHV